MNNMKKIMAFLLGCTMIGCTFTACGKDNDDDDSSAKSTSSSESTEDSSEKESAEKKTTEASADNEKTTEASTEASSEAKTTTDAKTEAPTEDNGGSSEGGNLETDVIGKWEASKMVAQGMEMTEFMGLPMHALMHIEIQPNGKCSVASPIDEEESQNGTWKISGKDTVSIDFPDENGESDAQEFKYKNGTLVASETENGETVEIHLKKVDKFSEFDLEKWQQDMQNSLGGMTQAETPAN